MTKPTQRSFARRYRTRVRSVCAQAKALTLAKSTQFELTFEQSNWMFRARVWCNYVRERVGTQWFDGWSVYSPEHAIEVLERQVAAAIARQTRHALRAARKG